MNNYMQGLASEFYAESLRADGIASAFDQAQHSVKNIITTEKTENRLVWESFNVVEPSDAEFNALPDGVLNYIRALEAIAPAIEPPKADPVCRDECKGGE